MVEILAALVVFVTVFAAVTWVGMRVLERMDDRKLDRRILAKLPLEDVHD